MDDENDVEIDNDESVRPCFSSISKGVGSLDKELAASGFTRKDQEDIEKVKKTIFLVRKYGIAIYCVGKYSFRMKCSSKPFALEATGMPY